MATYLRLFPATTQFELTNGQLNVAGRLYVYFEGTDDLADVYDEDGTQLSNPVILDNDGRAAGLFVDSSKVYWLKVCNQFDAQVFTVRKMVPSGGGAGSALGKSYEVISSDGTVDVQTYSDAGVITFDLSTQLEQQSSPFGGFIAMASSVAGDGEWHEVPVVSSQGDITYMSGWNVQSDCVGDIAASLEMTSGDPAALHTIDVMCMFTVDGSAVTNEFGMLDPSEPYGRVSFEWKGALVDDNHVDVKFFVRSNGAATVGLIGRALYNEEVEGIIGNGDDEYYGGDYIEISGQVINATGLQPLSGMSSYALTADMSAKMDASASSLFYPTSNPSGFITGVDLSDYATTGYVNSSVSSKLDESAFTGYTSTALTGIENNISALSSMVSSISGQTGNFVEKSSISSESATWNTVTAKLDSSAFNSGDFYPTSNPSGFITGVDLSDYATTSYVDSSVSSKLDESAFTVYTATALTGIENDVSALSSIVSSISGQTGDFVERSSISAESASWNEVSAKLDASAASDFYPTSNPSGFATTAYVNSSVSGKQDSSAMTGYIPTSESAKYYSTSNPSGFITGVDLTPYQLTTDMSGYLQTSESANYYPMTGNPSGFLTEHQELTGYIPVSALGIGEI